MTGRIDKNRIQEADHHALWRLIEIRETHGIRTERCSEEEEGGGGETALIGRSLMSWTRSWAMRDIQDD